MPLRRLTAALAYAGATLLRWLDHPTRGYSFLLLGLTAVACLRHPIVAVDTDLWCHLHHGRYILTQHLIPCESFFSFLEPPRPLVACYWLFQVVAYLLYALTGYAGLIVLRTACYLTTLVLIYRLLTTGQARHHAGSWAVVLSVCYGLYMMPRFLVVRPHVLTYLCIALALYLLETQPRRARFLLPLVVVAWSNLHGVTYPVVWLICGAYAVETVVDRWRGHAATSTRPALLPLIISMGAVLVTPYGARLFDIPVVSDFAMYYVVELLPIPPEALWSFHLQDWAPSAASVFHLLLGISLLALLTACCRRTIRLSHLLLWLGGLALLTRGLRFTYEYGLLVLPLLRSTPLVFTEHLRRAVPRVVARAGTVLFMTIPLCFVWQTTDHVSAYPLAGSGLERGVAGLPSGTARFLNQAGVGGRVLNGASYGGYLQWALEPHYTIFMDMEFPLMFSNEDAVIAQQVFVNSTVFRAVVEQYHPAFLAVPRRFREFPRLIAAFPEYAPAFLDDVSVLYVDIRQHPDLERPYTLAMDPFAFMAQSVNVLDDEGARRTILAQARRLLAVDPEGQLTNRMAALAYLAQQQYAQALAHADTLVKHFPEVPSNHRLRGDALRGLRRCDEAVAAYRAAVRLAEPLARPEIRKHIGLTYLEQGRYAKAYRLLRDAVNVYASETNREDIVQLARAAALAGKQREAKMLLGYLDRYR